MPCQTFHSHYRSIPEGAQGHDWLVCTDVGDVVWVFVLPLETEPLVELELVEPLELALVMDALACGFAVAEAWSWPAAVCW